MSVRELHDLQRHLSAANEIIERLLHKVSPGITQNARNPKHFRESGHLSEAGADALYRLFDAGTSIEEAAKQMGISVRGAAGRRQAWLGKGRIK